TASLLKNPPSGGSPTIAASPIVMDQNTNGTALGRSRVLLSEPSVPASAMTTPAVRNSSALNAAWASRWNRAVSGAATATAANMNPTWLIVDHARTPLTSAAAKAHSPAPTMPTAATTATTSRSSSGQTGRSLVSTYAPAATMVAAWMRALTGVGPAIAGGSHTWRGNCADFPTQPNRISSIDAVATPGATSPSSLMRNVPARAPRIMTPSTNPTSPNLVTRNAFAAAPGAAGSFA